MKTRTLRKTGPTIAAGWLSCLSRNITITGILVGSLAAASAGDFTTYTTNVVNPNGVVVTDATGNMISLTTFSNSVAQAWATDSGGVWDMEAPSGWAIANNDIATFTYGPAQTNSLTLTGVAVGTDFVNQNAGNANPSNGAGVPSSGTQIMAGQNGNTTDPRSFKPSKPLVAVGVIQVNRNDPSRLGYLTVQYLDGTTASTTAMPANTENFHGLTANPNNPIVLFTLMNGSSGGPSRWDDLGFIVSSQDVPATITAQPASQSIYEGEDLTLSVTAVGFPSALAYQWKAGAPYSGTYTNIPNATNATLTVPWITASADYVVVVTNTAGSVTSYVANVTVVPPMYVNGMFNGDFELPATGKINGGFDVAGANNIPGWRNAGPNQNDCGIEDSGRGYGSLWAAYLQGGQSGAYQITTNVVQQAGAVYTLTWRAVNSWANPGAKVSLLGASARTDAVGSMTTLASRTDQLTGNWWDQASWVQYVITYTAGAGDVGKYIGVAFAFTNATTGSWGNFDNFSLTITPPTAPPVILTQPTSHSAWLASTTTFTALASGSGLNYQWQAGDVGSGIYTNISNGGQFSGADTATLTISNVAVADGLDYIVIVSNVGGSVTNDTPATLTVNVNPPDMGAVASKTVNQYDNTTLSPAFVAGATSYQWMAGAVGSGIYTNLVDGGRFSGVNTATLTITNVQPADGLDYVLVASNVSGSTTNDPAATLTVNPIIYLETFTTTNASIAGIGWVADAVNGMYQNIDAGVHLVAYSSGLTNQAFYTTTKLDTGSTGIAFPVIKLADVSNLNFSVDNQSWWNPANLHTYFAVQINGGQWYVSTTEIPQANGNWTTQTQPIYTNYWAWNELTVSGTGGTNDAAIPLSIPLIGGAATNDLAGYITGAGLVVVGSDSAWTAFDNFKITGDGFTILPGLSIARSGSNVVVTWGYGTLMEATSLTGPWTPASGISPKTVSPSGTHFYRLDMP